MRATTLESFESDPTMQEIPIPQIAPNEVLVRVRASSVNPVDNAIAAGLMRGTVEHEFPVVLGRDYTGVVEQAGSDVTRYAEGEEVYGFLPCYGLYVPEFDEVWLRLVDGRPVSGITTRFLSSWCSETLQAAGKRIWVLIWDNASWHISKEVRGWIASHNRGVKSSGQG